MKKKLWMGSLILTATVLTASIAQASVADYESLTNAYKQDGKEYTTEEIKDGSVEVIIKMWSMYPPKLPRSAKLLRKDQNV